jgi:hypothetical protein
MAKCPPTDTNQCRIIINALQREIDRLLRRLGPLQLWFAPPSASARPQESDAAGAPSPSAATLVHRTPPIYAPPPLGIVGPAPLAAPAPSVPGMQVTRQITNLGTLIDAMA